MPDDVCGEVVSTSGCPSCTSGVAFEEGALVVLLRLVGDSGLTGALFTRGELGGLFNDLDPFSSTLDEIGGTLDGTGDMGAFGSCEIGLCALFLLFVVGVCDSRIALLVLGGVCGALDDRGDTGADGSCGIGEACTPLV
jgi:hypothetical protein